VVDVVLAGSEDVLPATVVDVEDSVVVVVGSVVDVEVEVDVELELDVDVEVDVGVQSVVSSTLVDRSTAGTPGHDPVTVSVTVPVSIAPGSVVVAWVEPLGPTVGEYPSTG
jgi:hypothetical protein